MKLIDGKAHSKRLRRELKEKVSAYKGQIGLAVILIGEDPASQVYVRNKIKACEEVGIRSDSYYLPADVSQEEVLKLISALNEDRGLHGILVQLPLPKHLNADVILKAIAPEKDVDGFGDLPIGALAKGKPTIVSCTPFGVMKLLEGEGISVAGKHAVILGRSNIVGKPMAMLLLNADATVTICHSKTEHLKEICASADLLIAAIGKPRFVTGDMVKEGAVVIDVGINRTQEGKLCGDVDFESVQRKASFLTPVPGGVGPMTITMLLWNTYLAAART